MIEELQSDNLPDIQKMDANLIDDVNSVLQLEETQGLSAWMATGKSLSLMFESSEYN